MILFPASKQMVFDVFGNAIGMLEELERRETSSQILPQSDIDLPNMITNDRNDVRHKTKCIIFNKLNIKNT